MKTDCCHYTPTQGNPHPVMWNPGNQVVQCHACGWIWKPEPAKTPALEEWRHFDLARDIASKVRRYVEMGESVSDGALIGIIQDELKSAFPDLGAQKLDAFALAAIPTYHEIPTT